MPIPYVPHRHPDGDERNWIPPEDYNQPLDDFTPRPVNEYQFESAKVARAQLDYRLAVAAADKRYQGRGMSIYSGTSVANFGTVKSNVPDEIVRVLNGMMDDLDEICRIFNLPKLRGVKVGKSNANYAAAMGEGVLTIQPFNIQGIGKMTVSAFPEDSGKRDKFVLDYSVRGKDKDGKDKQLYNYDAEGNRTQIKPWLATNYINSTGGKLRATMIHELAHHVHQSLWGKYGGRIHPADLEKRVMKNKKRGYPSRYAKANGKEWFAENFSLYFGGRRDLVDPHFDAFIKQVIADVKSGELQPYVRGTGKKLPPGFS